MNAFTSAVKSENQEVTIPVLIQSFLIGKNDKSGNYQALNGALFHNKTVIARRCGDGTVLLPSNSVSDTELNDALIGSLYANEVPFRRLIGFDTLLNSSQRVSDLRNGKYDDFRAIAKLFNFPIKDGDIEAIERAKSFTKNVSEFFEKIEKEEQDRVRTQEEKERIERVKREAISWDTGLGLTRNEKVEGAGGGIRLRLSTKKIKRPTIETSTGHTLSVRLAQIAWDFASQYWHGEKQLLTTCGVDKVLYNGGWRSSGRSANVTTDHLRVGCQKVTRKEAERFADVMGWKKKEPKK